MTPRSQYPHFESFLPSPAQEMLLKAGLLENPEAVDCWREYLKQVEFDDTDFGSSRLLPLVYRNLNALGYDDAYMGRMKGIYRRTWAENQKNFQHIPGLVTAFRAAGIPLLLLKGSALLLLCYRDFGLRAMGDFDLAVPAPRILEAVRLLEKKHWRACLEYPKLQIELHHAVHFQSLRQEDLDLHWHILVHRCEDAYDRPFWEGARPLEYKGEILLSPQPADHLLHACLHGAAWSPLAPIRWVADAYYLIRRCEIDWERILAMGPLLGMTPALQVTMSYLKERFSAPIPEDFLLRLAAIEPPEWQRREFDVLSRPIGFFGMLPLLRQRYSHVDRGEERFKSFPDYLRTYYGLENYRDLLRYFSGKAWQKLRRRLGFQASRSTNATPSGA